MENKLSIIPEVYYDFISRIPAGIILILIAAKTTTAEEHVYPELERLPQNVQFVIIPIICLVASYVIGLAVSSVSAALFRLSDLVYWLIRRSSLKQKVKAVLLVDPAVLDSATSKYAYLQLFEARLRMYTRLRKTNPTFAIEVGKHMAESALFTNIASGLLILLISSLVVKLANPGQVLFEEFAQRVYIYLFVPFWIVALFRQGRTTIYTFAYYVRELTP